MSIKKALSIVIAGLMLILSVSLSVGALVGIPLRGVWRNTKMVDIYSLIYQKNGETVQKYNPFRGESILLPSGTDKITVRGYITSDIADITGLAYSINGGEKIIVSDAKLENEPPHPVYKDKYMYYITIDIPLSEGSQMVRIYAKYTDGAFENIGAGEIVNGNKTSYTDNYIPEYLSGKNGSTSWKLDTDGTLTISGTGEITTFEWKEEAFVVKKIIIEEGITSIPQYMFSNHYNAESISLPDSLINIGNYAFENCEKLGDIIIPDNVESIGLSAFSSCDNIQKLKLGKNVKTVGGSAFADCKSLYSISFGDKIENIDADSFINTAYYNDEKNWENSLLYLGKNLLSSKTDISGHCSIKNGTTLIAGYAFSDRENLTSVTIPGSVETVLKSAFFSCNNLKTVKIENGVKNIADLAFYGCYRLETLTIGNTVKNIGIAAFAHCSALREVKIPNSVEIIGDGAFSGCGNLKSIILGKGVKTLGDNALQSQNVTDIYYLGSWEEWIKISKVDPMDEVFYKATIHYNAKTPSEFNTATTDAIVTGAPTENDLPVVTDAPVVTDVPTETNAVDITDTDVVTDDITTDIAETDNTTDDGMMSESEFDTEKADDTKTSETDGEDGGEDKSSPLPIIIAAAAVTVCVALGIIFVIKKKK